MNHRKVVSAVLASIIFLALFVGLFVNQQFREGRAVYIGTVPWTGGVIDLTGEESVSFTALPDEAGKEIMIKTGLHPYDEHPQDYRLKLFKVDAQSYGYSVSGVVERDLLTDGEIELVYLNEEDAAADLELAYRHGRIRIKNLHYLPPEAAVIKLLVNNSEQPSVISLVKGEEFKAVIEASSSHPPQLEVSIVQLSQVVEIPERNQTRANFSFPAEEQAQLIITATVRERESQAYYTLAVNDTLYRLREANFPAQKIVLTDDGAELEITFLPSRELQPLALPCLVEKKLDELFKNTSIKRLYSYSGGEPQIWNPGGASDFEKMELFKGYFVELDKVDEKKVRFDCQLQSFRPLSSLPDLEARTLNLGAGWNLFSIPGMMERKLTDYTFSRDFRVFECRLGYVCTEMAQDGPLTPGKPYWLYSEDGFDVSYRMG